MSYSASGPVCALALLSFLFSGCAAESSDASLREASSAAVAELGAEPARPASALAESSAPSISHSQGNVIARQGDLTVFADRMTARVNGQSPIRFVTSAGPDWEWDLDAVSVGGAPYVDLAQAQPWAAEPSGVQRQVGAVVEQYLNRQSHIEQRFWLQARPTGQGAIRIDGSVETRGHFFETETGWAWRDDSGVTALGSVSVFDAAGESVAAAMHVTATETSIVIEEAAWKNAQFPLLVDPSIGPNDELISDFGDGTATYRAADPAVAFSSTSDQYLVVWRADDNTDIVNDENEVFARFVGTTGLSAAGGDFRVSRQGVDGDATVDALTPAVAWNSNADEYFVVWSGDRVAGEAEIFGQRLDAAGAPLGAAIRLSDMGGDASGFDAFDPAVTYNATADEYLVVWVGDDVTSGDDEVFGQRVSAAGVEVGTNDFAITSFAMGTAQDPASPDVAWSAGSNVYLVVYHGDPTTSGVDEVWGQRIAADGSTLGAQIDLSGLGGGADTDAQFPSVTYNATNDEFLVAYHADESPGEEEVFVRRVSASGSAVRTPVRVTSLTDGTGRDARYADVAWIPLSNTYLVVWEDDSAADEAFDVYAQALSSTLSREGAIERVSDMGPEGDAAFDGQRPSVASSVAALRQLVAWHGDESDATQDDDEDEIFIQALGSFVAPTAATNGPYVGTEGTPIATRPDGSSDLDGTIVAYAWDFDDDGLVDDADLNGRFTYFNQGTYPIRLTVTDNDGLTATVVTEAVISNVAPTLDIGGDIDATVGEVVSFEAIATEPPGVMDRLEYAWDFGDGNTATGSTPTHVYASAGEFTVVATVDDGDGGLTEARLTARVTLLDVPPIALDDEYTTPEDVVLNVPAPGVLGNDTDDGRLTAEVTRGLTPDLGDLSFHEDGWFIFTPDDDVNGVTTFQYRVTDSNGATADATVTLTVDPVNDAPVAVADTASVPYGGTTLRNAPGVLGNDIDIDSPTLTAVLLTEPTEGTLTLLPDGEFTYVHGNAGTAVTDSFTYAANDGDLSSEPTTVTVTIGAPNEAPEPEPDSYDAVEDTPLAVAAAEGVLSNDSDPEGDGLIAVLVDDVSSGTLTLEADGSFVFIPAADSADDATFTYAASDTISSSAAVAVTIRVAAVNDAPVAFDQDVAMDEDDEVVLLLEAADVDSPSLTWSIVDEPMNGELLDLDTATGEVTYRATENYFGDDEFTFEVTDGELPSNLAVVSIAIDEVDDDDDGDTIMDSEDNCPLVANLDQEDRDLDGFGDACDLCPDVFDTDPERAGCPPDDGDDDVDAGDAGDAGGDVEADVPDDTTPDADVEQDIVEDVLPDTQEDATPDVEEDAGEDVAPDAEQDTSEDVSADAGDDVSEDASADSTSDVAPSDVQADGNDEDVAEPELRVSGGGGIGNCSAGSSSALPVWGVVLALAWGAGRRRRSAQAA